MEITRELIERHWAAANARDWEGFASILSPGLVYQVPQTRERVQGADGYLEFFRTWPEPWRADVQNLIAESSSGVCVIDFVVGHEHMTGISFFEVSDGLISRVTDFWPSAYEPPPRMSKRVERY